MRSANQALRQILDAVTEGDQVLTDKITPELLQNLRQTLDNAARCRQRALEGGGDADWDQEAAVYRELLFRLQSVVPHLAAGVRQRARALQQELARVGDVLAWNRTNQMTKQERRAPYFR
jgi:hypothetical protein